MTDKFDEEKDLEEGQNEGSYAAAADILGIKGGDKLSQRVTELEAEVEKYKELAEEHKDKTLRAFAEVENMRSKVLRDMDKTRKYALDNFVKELLPVADSLEHAMVAAREVGGAMLEGLELTEKMLIEVLQKHGVMQVNPVGEKFDPELHEALTMQPTDEHEANTIMSVVQKGYQLNGRVVRPARVIVAKAAE